MHLDLQRTYNYKLNRVDLCGSGYIPTLKLKIATAYAASYYHGFLLLPFPP